MADLSPEADVRVIRCSSLTEYPDCARRASAKLFSADIAAAGYELRRVRPSVAAHIGSGVHAGGAGMLMDKQMSGTWSADAGVDAGIYELRRRSLEEGVSYDEKTAENMTQAERQVQRMTLMYAREVVPRINPVSVEERLEATISEGLILSGQKDNVGREPRVLRDLKTGAKLRTYAPQVGGYSLLEKSHDFPVEEAKIDFVQRVSLKRDQPLPIEVTISLVQAETAAVKIIDMIARDLNTFRFGSPDGKIKPGDPWAFASNPSSGLCSARWCPAHSTPYCIEHGKENF